MALHRRLQGAGTLLVVTAFVWWLGNVVPDALFLHRGVLAVAVWTFPGPRRRVLAVRAAVVAGAVLAVPALARSDSATAVFGVVVLAGALIRFAGSSGGPRPFRRVALRAAVVAAVGGVGAAALRQDNGDLVGSDLATLWYQATIAVAGLVLVSGAYGRQSGHIADVVVDLSAAPRGPLRDRLADLLDDPDLVVARRSGSEWVDHAGRTRALPVDGGPRSTTIVACPGSDIAIVHDVSLASDPTLVHALEAVTLLAVRNAELDAAADRLLDDLAASRQRLLDVEDEERRRLSVRLHNGTGRRLDTVGAHLAAAGRAARGSAVVEGIACAAAQLDRARADLAVIAEGLHPGDPGGHLTEVMSALAAGIPLPVEIVVPADLDARVDARTAVALSYCCGEAVSNAVKHANATQILIELAVESDAVHLMVVDDGVGGADLSGGTGLRGLLDRAEALGGTLEVSSAPHAGTTVSVTLPLETESPGATTTGGRGWP